MEDEALGDIKDMAGFIAYIENKINGN